MCASGKGEDIPYPTYMKLRNKKEKNEEDLKGLEEELETTSPSVLKEVG